MSKTPAPHKRRKAKIARMQAEQVKIWAEKLIATILHDYRVIPVDDLRAKLQSGKHPHKDQEWFRLLIGLYEELEKREISDGQ